MNKKLKSKNRKRSLSRLMATQILYQYDFLRGEKSLDEIVKDVIENYSLSFEETTSSYRDKIDENFLNNLITGSTAITDELDAKICEFLKDGWALEKLDDVIKQILRLAIFELKFLKDIPYKVVIDEYVDIAGSFFDDKKITFINGILENLAKKLRAQEITESAK